MLSYELFALKRRARSDVMQFGFAPVFCT